MISGFILIVILIVASIFAYPRLFKSSKLIEKSIAVLPFITDNIDEENVDIVNEIMEQIINNLERIEGFSVISRSSVDKYRDHITQSIPEIANDLGVDYIVEGSLQRSGDKFSLSIQLIDGLTDTHLWAENFNGLMDNFLDIPEEVSNSIAESL